MRNIIEQLFDDRKKHTQHPILDHSVHEHQLVFQKLIDLRNRMTDKMESDPTSVVHYQLDKDYKTSFEKGEYRDELFDKDIYRTPMLELGVYIINFPETTKLDFNEDDHALAGLRNHHGFCQTLGIGKLLESREILCQVTDVCCFIIKDKEANYHTFSVSHSSENVIELQHMTFTVQGEIDGNKYIINSTMFPELTDNGPMWHHLCLTNNYIPPQEKDGPYIQVFELNKDHQNKKYGIEGIWPSIQNRNKSFTQSHLFYTETLIEKFKRWVFKIRTIGIISFLTVGVLIGILYSQLHHEYIWLATATLTILAPILISVYMLKNFTNKSCGAKIFGLCLIGIIAIAAILTPDLFLSFEIEIYKYLPNIILPAIIVFGVILLGSLFLKTHLPCIDSKHEVLTMELDKISNSQDRRVAKMACSKAFRAYFIYDGEDEKYPKEADILNTAQRNHLS